MTEAARDHLLRTLAAVPAGSRILDFDSEEPVRVKQLQSLGFDVVTTAAGHESEHGLRANGQRTAAALDTERLRLDLAGDDFDWIIADRSSGQSDSLLRTLGILTEMRRLLKPGGWIFLVLPAGDTASEASDDECLLAFYKIAAETDFELAESGVIDAESGTRFARAIFRRVEPDTPS